MPTFSTAFRSDENWGTSSPPFLSPNKFPDYLVISKGSVTTTSGIPNFPNNLDGSISFPAQNFYQQQSIEATLSTELTYSYINNPNGHGNPQYYATGYSIGNTGGYSHDAILARFQSGKKAYLSQNGVDHDYNGQRNQYGAVFTPYITNFGIVFNKVENDLPVMDFKFIGDGNLRESGYKFTRYGFLTRNDWDSLAVDYQWQDDTDMAADGGELTFFVNGEGGSINNEAFSRTLKWGWNLLEMRYKNRWDMESYSWIYILVTHRPVADFTGVELAVESGDEDDLGKVRFDASASKAYGNDIIEYSWNFIGNPPILVGPNELTPIRDYGKPTEDAAARNVIVYLYIKDEFGATDYVTKTITLSKLESQDGQIDALVLADGRVVTIAQDGKDVLTRVLFPTASGLKKLEESRVANAKLGSIAAKRDTTLVRTLRRSTAIEMETSSDGGKSWQ